MPCPYDPVVARLPTGDLAAHLGARQVRGHRRGALAVDQRCDQVSGRQGGQRRGHRITLDPAFSELNDLVSVSVRVARSGAGMVSWCTGRYLRVSGQGSGRRLRGASGRLVIVLNPGYRTVNSSALFSRPSCASPLSPTPGLAPDPTVDRSALDRALPPPSLGNQRVDHPMVESGGAGGIRRPPLGGWDGQ